VKEDLGRDFDRDMENGIDDAVQRLLNAYLLLQQPTLSLWLQSGTESSSRIGFHL
jgi:hypothetical protein